MLRRVRNCRSYYYYYYYYSVHSLDGDNCIDMLRSIGIGNSYLQVSQ